MNNNPIILLERTNIFACQSCSRAFLRQNDLDKHIARFNHVNQDVLKFKLPDFGQLPGCGNDKICVKNEFVLHNVTGIKNAEIQKRTKITKNKQNIKLKCESCGIKFEEVQDLVFHACASKSDKNNEKVSDHVKSVTKSKKKKQTKDIESKENLIEIEIEPKVTANHANKTKPDIRSIIPNVPVKQLKDIKKNNEIGSTKILTCGQCPKSFKTLGGMTNHLQKHLEPAYQCSQCLKTYLTAQKLNKHVSQSHTDRHRVQCDICHKELKNKINLAIHLRTHTGERPFLCKQCGKRFTQAAALYTHNKIHIGIKKHICTYCNKAFIDYHNMKTHERIHTNERPSECKYCNKAFSDPSALKRHIRTHTGSKIYQCPLCPMKFSDASGLIAHKKRHSGNKNFACNYCGKKFFNRHNQSCHETASHTKIKNFECDLCKKRFALKKYLRLHIIRSQH